MLLRQGLIYEHITPRITTKLLEFAFCLAYPQSEIGCAYDADLPSGASKSCVTVRYKNLPSSSRRIMSWQRSILISYLS